MKMTRRGKRRLAALLALIVLGGAALFIVSAVRAAQERKLIAAARAAGLSAYQAGDLDGALRQLSYFFEHVKNDVEVNFTFAEARARLPIPGGRHLWEAVDLLSNHCLPMLHIAGGDSHDRARLRKQVHERLLDLYCQMGLTYEVSRTADALLQMERDFVPALSAKTEALCMERQFELAQPLAERLIELEPDNLERRRTLLDIQRELGVAAEQRLETCRQWAREYDSRQGDGRFHVLMAAMLLDMDRLDEAKQELQRAASLGANEPNVLARSVELLDLVEANAAADSLIQATTERFPAECWPREVGVRRLWHAHRLAEALEMIEPAHADERAACPALAQLEILVQIAARNLDDARNSLAQLRARSAQSESGDEARALVNWLAAVASALDPQLPWRERAGAIDSALAQHPQDAALHSLKGDLWLEIGELARAVQSYSRAAALSPDWIAANVAQIEALLRSGRLEEAYRASRILLSRASSEHVKPFLLFARAHLSLCEAGRIIESAAWDEEIGRDLVTLLQELLEQPLRSEDRMETTALLADALAQFNGEQAALTFMRAQIDHQADAEVYLALADVCRRNQLDLEERLLERAREAGGLSVPVAAALAEYRARAGDPNAGVALFEAALDDARLEGRDLLAAELAQCRYMLRHGISGAIAMLEALVLQNHQAIEAQQFALADASFLRLDSDESARLRDISNQAMGNLKRLVGENSPQVRLAEANALIRRTQAGRPADSSVARAIRLIEAVLQQSPESLAGLSLMSEALMLIQPPNPSNLDRAIGCLEQAVNLYPAEPSLLVRLVAMLQDRGDLARAGQFLRRLAACSERNPNLRQAELRLWQAQGDFETALARAAAIVNETSPPSDQLLLAATLQRSGRMPEAEAIYERLLQSAPGDPLAAAQAADFYAETDRFDRGLELFNSIRANESVPNFEVMLGSFHQRHGRFEEAGRLLRQAVDRQPDSIEARLELAKHFLAVRDHGQAAQQAMEGLKRQAADAALQHIVGAACIGLEQAERERLGGEIARLKNRFHTADASNDLQPLLQMVSILAKVPSKSGAYAPSHEQLSNIRRLVEESASNHANRFLPAWQAAIQLHVDAKRFDEALALARAAVARFPSDPTPSQWATQLLLAAGSAALSKETLAEAQEWRRRLLIASGDSIAADVAIASVLLDLDRGEEAAAQIKRYAQRIWKDRAQQPERLATWLKAQVMSQPAWLENEDAQARVLALLNEDQRWRLAWLVMSRSFDPQSAFAALGLLQQSSLEAQELLALSAEWVKLGRAGAKAECFERARACAQQAGDKGMPVASLIAQGTVAEAQRDLVQAERLYAEALALDPKEAIAANNLAFVMSHNPDRCEEALRHADRALALNPDQPDFLDTRARILLALNRVEEAVAALNRAASLRPDDLGIALSLVEARMWRGADDSVAETLMDLQHRIRTQKWTDPELEMRLDALWQKFQQSRVGSLP